MATYNLNFNYKNINDLNDVRTALAMQDEQIKYVLSHLTPDENFTESARQEYAALLARVKALEET